MFAVDFVMHFILYQEWMCFFFCFICFSFDKWYNWWQIHNNFFFVFFIFLWSENGLNSLRNYLNILNMRESWLRMRCQMKKTYRKQLAMSKMCILNVTASCFLLFNYFSRKIWINFVGKFSWNFRNRLLIRVVFISVHVFLQFCKSYLIFVILLLRFFSLILFLINYFSFNFTLNTIVYI